MNLDIPHKLTIIENLKTNRYDTIVWWHGGGAAKTNALIKIAILESFIDDGVILCCREIQKSIADSLYSAIVNFISITRLTIF